MYIGLKRIQQLFKDYPTLLVRSDHTHCLTCFSRISKEQDFDFFQEHQLYVLEEPEKNGFHLKTAQDGKWDWECLPGFLHVLYIVKSDTDLGTFAQNHSVSCSLLVIGCDDAEKIYTKLSEFFNGQYSIAMFGQTLLESLSNKNSLQSAVDQAFRVFHNPVFIIDMNFNLISATWTALKKLDIQDPFIENKKLYDKDFRLISPNNRIHDQIMKSELPVIAFNDSLGYEQMYCAVNPNKNLGHIVVSAVSKPFEPIDKELMLVFKKYVEQQLLKDPFVRSAKGYDYEYFLKSVLDFQITSHVSNPAYSKYISDEFSGHLYCAVIDLVRSSLAIGTVHVRDIIESKFQNAKT